jgi:hypothetical protein
MAEITPIIASQNYFGLGVKFGTKSSEETEFQAFNPVFDADGNYLCSAEYDTGVNYTQDSDYCGGSAADIVADLGALLSQFGNVTESKTVTKLDVAFAAGIQAEAKIEGHQHDDNPHLVNTLRQADVSGVIPAASGIGVPTLIVVAGDVSPVNATVSFEMEHVDKPGADGKHFSGQNMRCHVSLSVDYEGHPTGVTAGDWLNIILAKSNPNDDTPTASLTCEQWIDVAEPAA